MVQGPHDLLTRDVGQLRSFESTKKSANAIPPGLQAGVTCTPGPLDLLDHKLAGTLNFQDDLARHFLTNEHLEGRDQRIVFGLVVSHLPPEFEAGDRSLIFLNNGVASKTGSTIISTPPIKN